MKRVYKLFAILMRFCVRASAASSHRGLDGKFTATTSMKLPKSACVKGLLG